jgi:hypothetical protein
MGRTNRELTERWRVLRAHALKSGRFSPEEVSGCGSHIFFVNDISTKIVFPVFVFVSLSVNKFLQRVGVVDITQPRSNNVIFFYTFFTF